VHACASCGMLLLSVQHRSRGRGFECGAVEGVWTWLGMSTAASHATYVGHSLTGRDQHDQGVEGSSLPACPACATACCPPSRCSRSLHQPTLLQTQDHAFPAIPAPACLAANKNHAFPAIPAPAFPTIPGLARLAANARSRLSCNPCACPPCNPSTSLLRCKHKITPCASAATGRSSACPPCQCPQLPTNPLHPVTHRPLPP